MPCLCFCLLVDAFGRAWRPGKRTPTRLRPGKNLAQQLLCQGRLKLCAIFGFKVFHILFMFPAFFGTMTSHGSIVFEWLEPPYFVFISLTEPLSESTFLPKPQSFPRSVPIIGEVIATPEVR